MDILITGAAGFSGRRVVSALLDAGHNVSAVVRRQQDRAGLLELGSTRLNVIAGDLAGELALPDRVDAIVHTAARSPPAANLELIRCNAIATARLRAYADAARAETFIYFSSLSVYGAIEQQVVNETTPILNPDVYGVTKYLGETVIRSPDTAMRSLSIRLPGIIGPGSARNWLTSVLTSAKSGRTIEFYDAGTPFNNAVHVADLCQFVGATLLRSDWTGHDVITLGAGGATTVRRAVEIIAAGFGFRSKLKARDDVMTGFTISIERARASYGYLPMQIEDMLGRFIEENRN